MSTLKVELLPASLAQLAQSDKEEEGEVQGYTSDLATRVAVDCAKQVGESPGIGDARPMANDGRFDYFAALCVDAHQPWDWSEYSSSGNGNSQMPS